MLLNDEFSNDVLPYEALAKALADAAAAARQQADWERHRAQEAVRAAEERRARAEERGWGVGMVPGMIAGAIRSCMMSESLWSIRAQIVPGPATQLQLLLAHPGIAKKMHKLNVNMQPPP